MIDHASGAGVAGAHVIEWYRAGSLTGADVMNVLHSRATQCDDTGHFVFPAGIAPGPGLWIRKSYGPSYSVYHPDYGLQHARAGSELHVDRSRTDVARDDLAALCRRGGDDPGTRRLIEVACPKLTPSRN